MQSFKSCESFVFVGRRPIAALRSRLPCDNAKDLWCGRNAPGEPVPCGAAGGRKLRDQGVIRLHLRGGAAGAAPLHRCWGSGASGTMKSAASAKSLAAPLLVAMLVLAGECRKPEKRNPLRIRRSRQRHPCWSRHRPTCWGSGRWSGIMSPGSAP